MTEENVTRFEPSSYGEFRPGEWLKSAHIGGGELTLTVTSFFGESFESRKKDEESGEWVTVTETRGILTFEENDLKLQTNKTNENLLEAMFGKNPKDVVGKRVTFFVGRDRFRRDEVDAIRIAGSPDLAGPVTKVVTYAARTGRKPKTFDLRVTDGAAPGNQLEQALTAIEGAHPDDLEILKKELRARRWSKEDGAALAAAFERRAK